MSTALPLLAAAEPARASLTVVRQVGAERCPAESELRALVEAIAEAPILSGSGAAPVALSVDVKPSGDGFVAVISLSGARSGERIVDDEGPGCDALAQALAVTIAILLDAGPGAAKLEPEPQPPRPEPPPAPEPAKPAQLPPSRPTRSYWLPAIENPAPDPLPPARMPALSLSLAGFHDSGTLPSATGALAVSADFLVPYVTLGVAFTWLPHATLELPAQTIGYRFIGGRARACLRDPWFDAFGAALCAGLLGGERSAALPTPEAKASGGRLLAIEAQLDVSRRLLGPFGLFALFGAGFPVLETPIEISLPGRSRPFSSPTPPAAFEFGGGPRLWFDL